MPSNEAGTQRFKAKRKLLEIISKMRPSVDKLPPERDLAAELSLSRGTLRLAIDELLLSGVLRKEEGRKGAFATGFLSGPSVGVLVGRGESASFSGASLDFLAALAPEFKKRRATLTALSGKAQDLDPERLLSRHALDALLWLFPFEATTAKLLPLVEKGLPLVLGPAWVPEGASFRSNFIAWDKGGVGEGRARHFLKRACRRVAYSGFDDATFRAFAKTMNEGGAPFDEAWHLKTELDVRRKLPSLVEKGEIDGLVSNGGLQRIEEVLNALESVPSRGKGVELVLDRCEGIERALRAHSSVEVAFFGESVSPAPVAAALSAMLFRVVESGEPQPGVFVLGHEILPAGREAF